MAWATSSSDAPRLISILSSRGIRWLMLARLRLTPVNFLGPVTKAKLLSTMSMTTHFVQHSRPPCLTHILPISMAGMTFLVSLGK